MLQPRRTKFRKQHRGVVKGARIKGSKINFGDFGLKTLEAGWITARQIEAARKAIVGHVKRGGQMWIRVFPDKPVSARPAETRMGKGKGAVEFWVSPVNQGKVLFELGDLPEELSREALRLASHKLSLKTKIVSRDEQF
ncbi:MAG: 50S ribosomal protein L16 [Chloroflexi bacterium]|nr:50S ribosomal protein L16 [Chloroflexota bacterium]|tara:strand:+ start:74 stop:490 length:417 start_codon:yes stop_codon:yes gene_type:complete